MNIDSIEKVIVVGCSSLGANIAAMLSKQGKEVVTVDLENESFNRLSKKYSGFNIVGDGTDVDILSDIGIKETDLVVVTTDDDNTNIMVSQLAKTIFNVSKVISRIYDVEKQPVYEGLDINIIKPFELSINEFERLLYEDSEEGEKN